MTNKGNRLFLIDSALSNMNSALYYKKVKQISQERGISESEARSYLGKRGAEARKRKKEAAQEKEKIIQNCWWNN